jgi:ABC-type multidrug transport system fused ATPase/permease subunit|tara:strand:+ start:690 stop:1049 length:360 start_codon:yes stop_codon:yes gene_type:complete
VLGQNGASLSGGQKQRVAIARALIRDPAVLLLDEATSALDPESARLVEAALRDASRDRSVVLTTHKLSQARLADRIVVMQYGAIAEEGSHAELVAKRGLYYEMLNTGTGDDHDDEIELP